MTLQQKLLLRLACRIKYKEQAICVLQAACLRYKKPGELLRVFYREILELNVTRREIIFLFHIKAYCGTIYSNCLRGV